MNSTVTVYLNRLRENYRLLRRKDAALMSVVKANAYGHGAVRCGTALWEEGCTFFAVANLNEGVQLRRALPHATVLILGYTPPASADALCRHRLTQCVFSLPYARALSARLTAPLAVHFKLDTGMHRLGFSCEEEGLDALCRAARLPHLAPTGIFTHPADTDPQGAQNQGQWARFAQARELLAARGLTFPLWHCQNSAAQAVTPPMGNLIRTGIALYGYPPFPFPSLRPVLEWHTRVVALTRVRAGETVGYFPPWRAPRESLIATLPIGYADGLRRDFRFARLGLRTGDAPVVAVCMDLCMLDVTHLPHVQTGDRVAVIDPTHTAADLAAVAGEIPYAVLCGIGRRGRRVYHS